MIVRMTQQGAVVTVWRVVSRMAGLWSQRLNGIAISPDSTKIWVTLTGPFRGPGGQNSGVLEVPAF